MTDKELVKQEIRNKAKKEAYSRARGQVPKLLRKTYPHIYQLLMKELTGGLYPQAQDQAEQSIKALGPAKVILIASYIRKRNETRKTSRRKPR